MYFHKIVLTEDRYTGFGWHKRKVGEKGDSHVLSTETPYLPTTFTIIRDPRDGKPLTCCRIGHGFDRLWTKYVEEAVGPDLTRRTASCIAFDFDTLVQNPMRYAVVTRSGDWVTLQRLGVYFKGYVESGAPGMKLFGMITPGYADNTRLLKGGFCKQAEWFLTGSPLFNGWGTNPGEVLEGFCNHDLLLLPIDLGEGVIPSLFEPWSYANYMPPFGEDGPAVIKVVKKETNPEIESKKVYDLVLSSTRYLLQDPNKQEISLFEMLTTYRTQDNKPLGFARPG